METPNMLRGEFYPTHLYQRCQSFRPCSFCRRCRNYCRHLQQCEVCENRKTNTAQKYCECTDQTREAMQRLESLTKMNLFQADAGKGGEVVSQDVSHVQDWDQLVENLQIKPERED